MVNPLGGPPEPTPGQIIYGRKHQFDIFQHFSENTFNDREWSVGSLPAPSLEPFNRGAVQWSQAARDAGAVPLILTAGHHNGLCLWPAAMTHYSVRLSLRRDGQADVVAESANACRHAKVKLGVYLSPWERHGPS